LNIGLTPSYCINSTFFFFLNDHMHLFPYAAHIQLGPPSKDNSKARQTSYCFTNIASLDHHHRLHYNVLDIQLAKIQI
jgi:hypothetical protein